MTFTETAFVYITISYICMKIWMLVIVKHWRTNHRNRHSFSSGIKVLICAEVNLLECVELPNNVFITLINVDITHS